MVQSSDAGLVVDPDAREVEAGDRVQGVGVCLVVVPLTSGIWSSQLLEDQAAPTHKHHDPLYNTVLVLGKLQRNKETFLSRPLDVGLVTGGKQHVTRRPLRSLETSPLTSWKGALLDLGLYLSWAEAWWDDWADWTGTGAFLPLGQSEEGPELMNQEHITSGGGSSRPELTPRAYSRSEEQHV